jgi:hypothetical protein
MSSRVRSLTDGLAVDPFGGWRIPLCSDGGLRDRFRGALLGMSLAPVALGCGPVHFPDALSQGLTQARLRAAVPKLLRYCDSWERRRDWVFSVSAAHDSVDNSSVDSSSADSGELIAWVQVLILGDFLEMVLFDFQSNFNPAEFKAALTGLKRRLTHYDLTTSQHQYYLETLAELASASQPSNSSAFAGAILSALHYCESYGFCVQAAAAWGGIAPAIAGLLAGARGSQSCIPVLWLSTEEPLPGGSGDMSDMKQSAVVAMADKLFAQWAGIP